MASFWERTGAIPLPGKVRQVLERECGVSFARSSGLRMIAESTAASGPSRTRFRVFDPDAATERGVEPRHYRDLDAELVLYAGHLEPDGTVVLAPTLAVRPP